MGEYLKSELKVLLSGHHGNPHSDIGAQKVPTNRAPHLLLVQVCTTSSKAGTHQPAKGEKGKEKLLPSGGEKKRSYSSIVHFYS